MRVPERWLRSFVDPDLGIRQIGDTLTMIGLEVETLERVAPPFSDVVVCQVVSVNRHPQADRLNICQVNTGSHALRQVVCGAPNVAQGIRVACALPGARLPNGTVIAQAVVRGVESAGMLCSATELGISEDAAGLLVLDVDAPLGVSIREVLHLDEHCLTLKLTPNRGDCLSMHGVARELAAATGAKLHEPVMQEVAATTSERLPVRILAPDLCGRFSGRVIRGLNAAAATPGWMRERLERAGQRSLSALVDISNYVMLELGRPTHVFDLAKVTGSLTVRWGHAGEEVVLLNGQKVVVDAKVGVIADDAGIESLAGIMGGASTAVSLATEDVFVEAAFWWPDAIRGRARRFNFSTDAAHRFERGVDASTTVQHLHYITALIIDICGTDRTVVGPADDQIRALPERPDVVLRVDRCRRVLGLPLAESEMIAALDKLGLQPRKQSHESLVVTPPPWRFDLQIEEDLIEEVARMVGFDRIPSLPPATAAVMLDASETRRSVHDVRGKMASLGFNEVVNFSFVDAQWERDFALNAAPIRVLNPIANHLGVMRSNLIAGLVDTLKFNLNRRAERVRLFEIGRRFLRDPSVLDGPLAVAGVSQPNCVAALAYGAADAEQWGTSRRAVDFFDLKGNLEALAGGCSMQFVAATHPALHPGRTAHICIATNVVGWIGELHPRLQQKYDLPLAPVVFEILLEDLQSLVVPAARQVSRQPMLTRDIAVWVDLAVPAQLVVDAVWQAKLRDPRLSALREFRLFDVYRPHAGGLSKPVEGEANVLFSKEKSLAFRWVLQDTQRALSDVEADAAMVAITEVLASAVGARLRQ